MSVKDRITKILQQALDPLSLEVIDDSHRHAGHSGARDGGDEHISMSKW